MKPMDRALSCGTKSVRGRWKQSSAQPRGEVETGLLGAASCFLFRLSKRSQSQTAPSKPPFLSSLSRVVPSLNSFQTLLPPLLLAVFLAFSCISGIGSWTFPRSAASCKVRVLYFLPSCPTQSSISSQDLSHCKLRRQSPNRHRV